MGSFKNEKVKAVSLTNFELKEMEEKESIVFPYSLWLYMVNSNLTYTALKIYQYFFYEMQKAYSKYKEIKPILISRAKLCEIFTLKKTAINNALHLLREHGWVKSESRYHKITGFQQASIFWVCVPIHIQDKILKQIHCSQKENNALKKDNKESGIAQTHYEAKKIFRGTANTISRIPSIKGEVT